MDGPVFNLIFTTAEAGSHVMVNGSPTVTPLNVGFVNLAVCAATNVAGSQMARIESKSILSQKLTC